MSLIWLNSDTDFPPVTQAREDGLLAAGADLAPQRILTAYRQGIFPWFNQDDPVLWWSPDPRMVLFTHKIRISKSLARTLRKTTITITFDRAFEQVMRACALPRKQQASSDADAGWIHDDMITAYVDLHRQGYAHSVECWQQGQLVGGLYGLAIGKMFFGESMFSRQRDSSKIALVALCDYLHEAGFPLIDCQVYSRHLASLGAETIPRDQFIQLIRPLCDQPCDWDNTLIQSGFCSHRFPLSQE